MGICADCDQEMREAATCLAYGEVDPSVVAPGSEGKRCHDCGVLPGGVHHPGCDTERCSVCGGQWITCAHEEHDGQKSRWTGEWPGVAECRALGWYSRDLHLDGTVPTKERPIIIGAGNMRWHEPCGPDDEGAREDLNRWARHVRSGGKA